MITNKRQPAKVITIATQPAETYNNPTLVTSHHGNIMGPITWTDYLYQHEETQDGSAYMSQTDISMLSMPQSRTCCIQVSKKIRYISASLIPLEVTKKALSVIDGIKGLP